MVSRGLYHKPVAIKTPEPCAGALRAAGGQVRDAVVAVQHPGDQRRGGRLIMSRGNLGLDVLPEKMALGFRVVAGLTKASKP